MSQLCILVHSFDAYAHLWPGFEKAFKENWNLQYPPAFFASDVETSNGVGKPFKMIYSGRGEWADRLTKVLLQLPFDYIFYMQEDHYPTAEPPLHECWSLMDDQKLNRLQLSPVNQFYSLHGGSVPIYFHPSSKYLVSHQPSIWRKEFLLSCLKSGESPWDNEYEGTKRLNNNPEFERKIAIYPCDWYSHKCVKGVVVN